MKPMYKLERNIHCYNQLLTLSFANAVRIILQNVLQIMYLYILFKKKKRNGEKQKASQLPDIVRSFKYCYLSC